MEQKEWVFIGCRFVRPRRPKYWKSNSPNSNTWTKYKNWTILEVKCDPLNKIYCWTSKELHEKQSVPWRKAQMCVRKASCHKQLSSLSNYWGIKNGQCFPQGQKDKGVKATWMWANVNTENLWVHFSVCGAIDWSRISTALCFNTSLELNTTIVRSRIWHMVNHGPLGMTSQFHLVLSGCCSSCNHLTHIRLCPNC